VPKFRLLLWDQRVDDWFDTSIDESLEDLGGDTQKRYRAIAYWAPNNFFGLPIATIGALLQIFGILSWRPQEMRKSQNPNSKADPAWSINQARRQDLAAGGDTFLKYSIGCM